MKQVELLINRWKQPRIVLVTVQVDLPDVLAWVHVWSLLCPENDLCTYTCTFMVSIFPGDLLIKYPVGPSLPPTFFLRVPAIQNINLASPCNRRNNWSI